MENIQDNQKQAKANQFWETHFSHLMGEPIDERYALQIDFWTKLKTAFEAETIDAVMLSKIALPIANASTHLKIVTLAK